MMRESLLAVATVLMSATVASPASAQGSNLHFGPLVSGMYDNPWEYTRFGVYAGVSLDAGDHLRLGVFYVQKGRACCRVHTIELPVLYKHRLTESSYLVAGPALSYGDYPDIGVVVGLGVRAEDRPIGAEAAFVYGLLRDAYAFAHHTEAGHRVLRFGLEIPVR